jgi:hypothetical protein
MTFLRIVIPLYPFDLSMIFSENRYPLFRIMLWPARGRSIETGPRDVAAGAASSWRRYCFKNTLTPPWREQAFWVLVMVQTSSAQRAAALAGAVSVQGQATTCPGHFPQVTRPVGLT